MGYVLQSGTRSPQTQALARPSLGDATSTAPSGPTLQGWAGFSPGMQILIFAAGALAFGMIANAWLTGARTRARDWRHRKVRRAKRTVSGAAHSAVQAQNPVWMTLLLLAAAGGAIYYFASHTQKRNA